MGFKRISADFKQFVAGFEAEFETFLLQQISAQKSHRRIANVERSDETAGAEVEDKGDAMRNNRLASSAEAMDGKRLRKFLPR